MSEPQTEIKRAAEAHKKKLADQKRQKKIEQTRAETGDPGILFSSLSDRDNWQMWATLLALVLAVFGFGWTPLFTFPVLGKMVFGNFLILMLYSGILIVLIIYLFISIKRVVGRLRLGQLRHIRDRYGFDLDQYLHLLSQARPMMTQLQLRICFDTPWAEELRQDTIDAVCEKVSEIDVVRWDGESELLIETKGEATTDRDRYSQIIDSEYYTNRQIDRCFDLIVRRVLPMLDRAVRIVRIEPHLTGSAVSPVHKP